MADCLAAAKMQKVAALSAGGKLIKSIAKFRILIECGCKFFGYRVVFGLFEFGFKAFLSIPLQRL